MIDVGIGRSRLVDVRIRVCVCVGRSRSRAISTNVSYRLIAGIYDVICINVCILVGINIGILIYSADGLIATRNVVIGIHVGIGIGIGVCRRHIARSIGVVIDRAGLR